MATTKKGNEDHNDSMWTSKYMD
ncbi:uncharacterized protein G2W53_043275 [Senna tora]|uniref:Uncharacterized protein n=1 Tax=Senna tora TaxID=362788 RepID=A0A834SVA5_9FABA|nr:uncharacterized protein G2W53_043275 [Senna tora]